MINLDSIKLQNINKPARYVGSEVNQIIKSGKISSSVVVCYLNVYEKAMSNYIVNLLYNNINLIDSVWCKRCFAPDLDFQELLKKNNLELYSLEDFKSIKENDILLFVLDNELDYTNFFNMLKLSNIEINKEKRSLDCPKIILLPINNVNVKPLEKYADFILSFESEKESIQRILKFVKDNKENNIKEKVCNIELLTNDYDNIEIAHVENSIIPSIKINNSAIIIDFNFMDDINVILKYIEKSVKARGINTVSFINYDKIDQFKFCEYVYKIKANIEDIRIACKNIDFNIFRPEMLDVLLPCMEHNAVMFNVITCSEKLNNKANMGTEKEALLEKIKKVFKNNRNSIKLNFLIGLPEETYEDIDNIFELLNEIVTIYSKNKAKDKFSMKVNIDYYIPKEKEKVKTAINNVTKLETKVRYILEKEYDYSINLEVTNVDSYITRLLLASADNKLAPILYDAYKAGARFDSDNKKYNKAAWEKSLFDNIDKINESYGI